MAIEKHRDGGKEEDQQDERCEVGDGGVFSGGLVVRVESAAGEGE